MKILPTFVAVFSSLSSSTGTVVLVEFVNDQIIVAADSRDSGTGRDEACKITELDRNNFFFATGQVGVISPRTGKAVWDATEFSNTAFSASSGIKDRFRLVRTAANWAELMRERFQDNLKNVRPTKAPIELGQGFFAADGSEGLQMYHVSLQYVFPPSVPIANTLFSIQEFKPGDLALNAFGEKAPIAAVSEFLADTTPRAKEVNAIFRDRFKPNSSDYEARRIQAAIQTAIKWMPNSSIGGDVDLMILEGNRSIRWIDMKKNCDATKVTPPSRETKKSR
jgi:hypothetical protein